MELWTDDQAGGTFFEKNAVCVGEREAMDGSI
jgi:hypothetical protein